MKPIKLLTYALMALALFLTTNTNPVLAQTPTIFSSPLFVSIEDNQVSGEVSRLQTCLKEKGFYTYSEITGYFGLHTQSAVQSFQSRNSIVSSGSPKSTGYGYVGPRTRALLNSLCVSSQAQQDEINSIVITNNSGECLGYCTSIYKFTPHEVEITRKGSVVITEGNKRREKNLPTQNITLPLTNEWQSLINALTIDVILDLPETIGCPDCVDSGEQTIELSFKDKTSKSVRYDRWDYKTDEPKLIPIVSKVNEIIDEINSSLLNNEETCLQFAKTEQEQEACQD